MALPGRSARGLSFQDFRRWLDSGLMKARKSFKLIWNRVTLPSCKRAFRLLRVALLLAQAFELTLALGKVSVARPESFLADSQRLLVEFLRLFGFTAGFA
jgi:hypothetical protein